MPEIQVEHVKYIMQTRPSTPIFGICLGNQILALAAGASTYKSPGTWRGCTGFRSTELSFESSELTHVVFWWAPMRERPSKSMKSMKMSVKIKEKPVNIPYRLPSN